MSDQTPDLEIAGSGLTGMRVVIRAHDLAPALGILTVDKLPETKSSN